MKNIIIGIAVVLVLGGAAYFFAPSFFIAKPPVSVGGAGDHSDLIKISNVVANQKIESPFKVQGLARGSWYFEASFPVVLIDANNKVLFYGPAQAEGDWMTTDFVPFSVALSFVKPTTKTGTLILKKDNPSGDPLKDDNIEVLVRF